MSVAAAETRGPLANLSSPTVKDDLGKIGGAAETAQEALSLIVKTINVGAFMEKVEMFLPIVDGISEVHPYAKIILSLMKGPITVSDFLRVIEIYGD
ncbi:hypothetical protein EW026_g3545 [Hermanssonia centrifuga]|uniref:Uncharacterized protein n=1 Tax=Hermanssonia centrifuga TaxID=98765 RepID=A0A4S4KKW3_9APHY|nr:hypothetical protein EW026_g3545 [Hermanssonia centrifuga]